MSDTETPRERVLACLERIENGFHRKWDEDPDFREELEGKDRDIQIELTDVGTWTLVVREGFLEEVREEAVDDADVHLTATSEDFLAVFEGELSPLRAYMTNRIDVDAGLGDILLVKSFL